MSRQGIDAEASAPSNLMPYLRTGALALALLLAIFVLFIGLDVWRVDMARTLTSLTNTAQVEGREIEDFFKRHQHELQALHDEVFDADGGIGPDAAVAAALNRAMARVADWSAVAVSRPQGEVLGGSWTAIADSPAGADWDHALRELQAGAPLNIGRSVLGRVPGQWVVPLRHGVRDRSGRLTHVISAAISVSRLVAHWQGAQFPLGAGVALVVVQEAVHVIAHHPLPAGSKPEDHFGKPMDGALATTLRQASHGHGGVFEGESTLSGTSAVVGYARLESYPVVFLAQSSKALLWQRWWEQLRAATAMLACLLLGGFAIFRWVLGRATRSALAAEESQRRLRESEERLALAVKGTRDGIWDWNVRTDETYFSPRWKQILGFAEDELDDTADAFFERLHPDDKARAIEAMHRQFDLAEPYAIEARLLRKDGSYCWIHTRGEAVRGAQGKIERMAGSIADITERKAIEESLRQSEQRYRQIVETAREGIWVIDQNNVTTLANHRMAEILGWDADALLGTSMFDHMDERGRALATKNVERRRLGIAEEHEFPFRRRDGSTVWTLLGSSPLLGKDGHYEGALAMVTDITERKHAEDWLRISDERLRQAVYLAKIGIFDHDHRSATIYWSPELRAMYGWPAEGNIGLDDFIAGVHADDRVRVHAAVQHSHDPAGDGQYEVAHRFILPAFGERWIEARGQTFFEGSGAGRHPVRTVGAVVDITERKRSETALQLSEMRLRQAVRATRSGIFDHNHLADTIYWSPEQRLHFGFGADEPVTLQGILDCVYPDDLPRIAAAVAAAHDPLGDGLYDVEHRIVRRNGQMRWLSTRSITLFEGEGAGRRAVSTVGAVVDITERRESEELVRTALREKEILLKEIYHRVKNNLQVIASLLSLQGRNDTGGAARRMLEDSANRVKSMALVHEQLYQGRNLSTIDFAAYLAQLVRHLGDAYGDAAKRTGVRLDASALELGIETAVPLGLIINELVCNCYKHAYPGGRGGEVLLSLKRLPDGSIEVIVADHGVGLPAGFRPEAAGSLGMRLVASLTEQLGGTLRHGPSEAGGYCCTLRFLPEDSEAVRLSGLHRGAPSARPAAEAGPPNH